MKFNYKAILATLSLSPLMVAMPALADYPALYWWQQPLNVAVPRCLRNAEQAMRETRLQGIRRSSNDVNYLRYTRKGYRRLAGNCKSC
ncbi:MAG: hypothetical protein U7123_15735 [Potamolinea sp.]